MLQQVNMSDPSSIPVPPVLLQSPFGPQCVLFIEVHRDDAALLASGEADWLRVLLEFVWQAYRRIAAQYYQALHEFNVEAARRRVDRRSIELLDDDTRAQATLWSSVPDDDDDGQECDESHETREDATIRLMRERPTGGNVAAPILHPTPQAPRSTPTVHEDSLAPGVIPIRMAGRAPKCFFALFKAFMGVQAMGRSATAEEVYHYLQISPSLVRACGFTQPRPDGKYRQSDIPGLRKLEQFEQIMAARGLWAAAKVQTVGDNIDQGIIELKGQDLAQDTTHYFSFSAMNVVDEPAQEHPSLPSEVLPETRTAPEQQKKPVMMSHSQRRGAHRAAREKTRRRWREAREAKKAKGRGSRGNTVPTEPTRKQSAPASAAPPAAASPAEKKSKRKSQSRTIKNCRCDERETCPHPWELSDPGAGTVVKGGRVGGKQMYWAHKAAVLSTAPGGIPLDAVAMTDAASHDGTALVPQLRKTFEDYPQLKGKFKSVLADTAMDDADSKQTVRDEFGLDQKTPTNPRNIKTRTADIGRGMKSLTPIGTLTCQADREMPFKGVSFERERFLYGSPRLSTGELACLTCPLRETCCRRDTKGGREVEIPITHLSHIDPGDPPMSRRFKALMRNRTSVERAIKRIKLDLGDDRLKRRGNDAFQAHLDRSLIALHLLLRLKR